MESFIKRNFSRLGKTKGVQFLVQDLFLDFEIKEDNRDRGSCRMKIQEDKIWENSELIKKGYSLKDFRSRNCASGLLKKLRWKIATTRFNVLSNILISPIVGRKLIKREAVTITKVTRLEVSKFMIIFAKILTTWDVEKKQLNKR